MASWGEGGAAKSRVQGGSRLRKGFGVECRVAFACSWVPKPKTFIFRGPGLMLARGYGLENLRVYGSMAEGPEPTTPKALNHTIPCSHPL